MTRKINVRNIGMILAISCLNMVVGFYDRITRETGVIKSIMDFILPTTAPQTITEYAVWNSTTGYSLTSSGISGLTALIIIIVAMVLAFFICGFMSMKGGMN